MVSPFPGRVSGPGETSPVGDVSPHCPGGLNARTFGPQVLWHANRYKTNATPNTYANAELTVIRGANNHDTALPDVRWSAHANATKPPLGDSVGYVPEVRRMSGKPRYPDGEAKPMTEYEAHRAAEDRRRIIDNAANQRRRF